MTARKAIFGLCALCAMLFSAFAAQGASAASQTAVTCATTGTQIAGTEKFSDEHCKTKNGTTGPRYHVAITEKTEGKLSNNTTGSVTEPGFLKATIAGLETIIEATGVEATGTIENGLSGTEMFASGETSTIKFTGVTVTNRTCTFTGDNPGGSKTVGSVETQPIVASTKGQPTGVVLFEPKAGPTTKFAEFELSGASCPAALKSTYPVLGTVLSNAAEGATLPINHLTVTGESSTKLRLKSSEGPLAGLAGKITIKAGKVGKPESEWNPISVT